MNTRIGSSVPTARLSLPQVIQGKVESIRTEGTILNTTPKSRITAGTTVSGSSSTSTFAGKGYPLGLLLTITYTQAQSATNTVTVSGGQAPRAYING